MRRAQREQRFARRRCQERGDQGATSQGKFLVGHVGALDNGQKGQEFIIAAARELERSHPDVHFMLVGGGDDEAMLRSAAAGLSNLTFTGFVDNVGDYLAAFDVFILPSNREGIGSILLDAMEQGLPVIASRVGGVPDIVHRPEERIADRSRELRSVARCAPHVASRSRAPPHARPVGAGVREGLHGRSRCAASTWRSTSPWSAGSIRARVARRSMTALLKALCITEDPDRPTTAMFAGLKNAGVDVTVVCPAGERRDVARAERRARARSAATQAARPRSRAAAPRRA